MAERSSMNHFRKVSQPCLTTRGFTALRCPFGATLSLVRHGLASFDLQTFLRTKTVNKKVSTFKGALTSKCARAEGYGNTLSLGPSRNSALGRCCFAVSPPSMTDLRLRASSRASTLSQTRQYALDHTVLRNVPLATS